MARSKAQHREWIMADDPDDRSLCTTFETPSPTLKLVSANNLPSTMPSLPRWEAPWARPTLDRSSSQPSPSSAPSSDQLLTETQTTSRSTSFREVLESALSSTNCSTTVSRASTPLTKSRMVTFEQSSTTLQVPRHPCSLALLRLKSSSSNRSDGWRTPLSDVAPWFTTS